MLTLTWLGLGLAADLHTRTFQLADNRYVRVSHRIQNGEITFEVVADSTGYIVVAYSTHHDKHEDGVTVYDAMMVGFKDGVAYAGSYELTNGHYLDRQPEVRYRVESGSESQGITTVNVARDITTCFDESFDFRHVGDVALVLVAASEEDPDDVSPYMPEYVDLRLGTVREAKGYTTLFTHSKTFVDHLDSELPTTNNDLKREAFQDNVDPTSSLKTCTIHRFSDDFDFYVGYKPDFSPSENEEHIRLIMAYQCDNVAIADENGDPDTNDVSDDGCVTDLGVNYDVSRFCKDPLFAWAPGSEGESLPSGFGVPANAPQSDGDRYVMLVVTYRKSSYDDNDIERDNSGMAIYVSEDSSLTPAAKMLVGHHTSSKLIVMPTPDWTVEGVCSASCTGYSGLSDEASVSKIGLFLSCV